MLYAVDAYKLRLQQPSGAAPRAPAVRDLLRGVGAITLGGSAPVYGVFFASFAPLRELARRHTDSEAARQATLAACSALCAVPASLAGVPADVVKKRLVLAPGAGGAGAALRALLRAPGGARNLFAGAELNLLRDVPFVGLKMAVFEALCAAYSAWGARAPEPGAPPDARATVTPRAAAVIGAGSGALTALVTAPLDAVNTAVKARAGTIPADVGSSARLARAMFARDGPGVFFRGAAVRVAIVTIGSTIFWPVQVAVAARWLDPG